MFVFVCVEAYDISRSLCVFVLLISFKPVDSCRLTVLRTS